MKRFTRFLVLTALSIVLVLAAAVAYLMNTGLTARATPGPLETAMATRVRDLTIGWHARKILNPTEATVEALAEGRAHFADHCATCHANDGSGNTELGQGLFPKPPDMRLPRTQNLTDGELFLIIENGVRFTGMPGFGTGNPSAESSTWPLVHFIRHLPNISEEELAEMQSLNPAPPDEIRQRLLEEQFLQGSDPAPPSPTMPHHKGVHP
jgi:mono/diheme cytochrome c family protein